MQQTQIPYNQTPHCVDEYISLLDFLSANPSCTLSPPTAVGMEYLRLDYGTNYFVYQRCWGSDSVFPFVVDDWVSFGQIFVDSDEYLPAHWSAARVDICEFFTAHGIRFDPVYSQLFSPKDYICPAPASAAGFGCIGGALCPLMSCDCKRGVFPFLGAVTVVPPLSPNPCVQAVRHIGGDLRGLNLVVSSPLAAGSGASLGGVASAADPFDVDGGEPLEALNPDDFDFDEPVSLCKLSLDSFPTVEAALVAPLAPVTVCVDRVHSEVVTVDPARIKFEFANCLVRCPLDPARYPGSLGPLLKAELLVDFCPRRPGGHLNASIARSPILTYQRVVPPPEWVTNSCVSCSWYDLYEEVAEYGDPEGRVVQLKDHSLVLATNCGIYEPRVLWFPRGGTLRLGPEGRKYVVFGCGPKFELEEHRPGDWAPPIPGVMGMCGHHALCTLGLDPKFAISFPSFRSVWGAIGAVWPKYITVRRRVNDPLCTRAHGVPDLKLLSSSSDVRELRAGLIRGLQGYHPHPNPVREGQLTDQLVSRGSFAIVPIDSPRQLLCSPDPPDVMAHLRAHIQVRGSPWVDYFEDASFFELGKMAAFVAWGPGGGNLLCFRAIRPGTVVFRPAGRNRVSARCCARSGRLGSYRGHASSLALWAASQLVDWPLEVPLLGSVHPNLRLAELARVSPPGADYYSSLYIAPSTDRFVGASVLAGLSIG